MASKPREQQSPVKRRFSSPLGNQKYVTKGISPRLKANLKDFRSFGFAKQSKQRGDLGPNHGRQWKKPNKPHEKNKKTPIRFHNGGNSADPLNLNSLIDRDPSFVTPQASPLSVHSESPVEVLEPRDKTDPLNLKGFAPEPVKEEFQVTPKKRKKRKRHQNSHHDGNAENEMGTKEQSSGVGQKEVEFSKGKRKKKRGGSKSGDVSDDQSGSTSCIEQSSSAELKTEEQMSQPVDEDVEPSPKKKKHSDSSETVEDVGKEEHSVTETKNTAPSPETCRTVEKGSKTAKHHGPNKGKDFSKKDKHQSGKFARKEKLFVYGNYNRYYGYRNPHSSQDMRLKCFKKEWFTGKDVLDIGCNVGHVTLTIARDYNPHLVIGCDIDSSLIRAAKSNLRYYVETPVSLPGTSGQGVNFPVSFSVTCGPLAAPVVVDSNKKSGFPHNVIFKQEDYVPSSKDILSRQKPIYDMILCLSVTKWVQLNWGDEGLKLMFRRMFMNLRPGGRLILEPQPFSSYKKKKNLTEKIRANYDAIKFRPEQFIDYLLSDMVGFVTFEVLEIAQHKAAGFQRPLYLLTKASDVESVQEKEWS